MERKKSTSKDPIRSPEKSGEESRYRLINQGIKNVVVITETDETLSISHEKWRSFDDDEVNALEKFMKLHQMTRSRQLAFERKCSFRCAKVIKKTETTLSGKSIVTLTAVNDDALF